MVRYGIGLTDLVKGKAGMDHQLTAVDFDFESFRHKIIQYQPTYLCFNGKRAAQEFLGRKVAYGLQVESMGSTKIFVAPSTSGAANRYWNIELWCELARLCRE